MPLSEKTCIEFVDLLRSKIKNCEPIDEFLAAINPSYLASILNYKKNYGPEGVFSYDRITLVYFATIVGNLPALKALGKFGAKFTELSQNNGMSELHFAALGNHSDIIDYLILERGLHVDSFSCPQNDRQRTPLYYCARGCVEAARKLIEYGADVNYASSSDGMTVLHSVCNNFEYSDHSKKLQLVALAEVLIENGADTLLLGINDPYYPTSHSIPTGMISGEENRKYRYQIQDMIDRHNQTKSSQQIQEITPKVLTNSMFWKKSPSGSHLLAAPNCPQQKLADQLVDEVTKKNGSRFKTTMEIVGDRELLLTLATGVQNGIEFLFMLDHQKHSTEIARALLKHQDLLSQFCSEKFIKELSEIVEKATSDPQMTEISFQLTPS